MPGRSGWTRVFHPLISVPRNFPGARGSPKSPSPTRPEPPSILRSAPPPPRPRLFPFPLPLPVLHSPAAPAQDPRLHPPQPHRRRRHHRRGAREQHGPPRGPADRVEDRVRVEAVARVARAHPEPVGRGDEGGGDEGAGEGGEGRGQGRGCRWGRGGGGGGGGGGRRGEDGPGRGEEDEVQGEEERGKGVQGEIDVHGDSWEVRGVDQVGVDLGEAC